MVWAPLPPWERLDRQSARFVLRTALWCPKSAGTVWPLDLRSFFSAERYLERASPTLAQTLPPGLEALLERDDPALPYALGQGNVFAQQGQCGNDRRHTLKDRKKQASDTHD